MQDVNKAIEAVTDIMNNRFAFNIAIAELMRLTNVLSSSMSNVPVKTSMFGLRSLVLMLAPLAPHISTCLWQTLNDFGLDEIKDGDVHEQRWPEPRAGFDDETTNFTKIVVQVSGKHFVTAMVPAAFCSDCDTLSNYIIKSHPRLQKRLQSGILERTMFEATKFVNFLLKPEVRMKSQ